MREWLRRYGIKPRKAWGQHFLVNPRIPERLIAGWDLDPETGVLEIGAGAGALTLPLLARGLEIVAVEKDRLLCDLLRRRIREECSRARVRVLEQDILALEPGEALAWPGSPERWVLVGNLPYAITTGILEWAIRVRKLFAWVSFMVQREYAARILATPGCASYGSLTLWVGFHFRPEKEMAVSAANFWPMPRVDSVVLRLWPRLEPPVDVPSGAVFERVVRAAFSHRRKVLGGSLSRGLGLERRLVEKALCGAGIATRKRAQECSLEEFAALTRSLAAGWTKKGGDPWDRRG